MSLRAKLEAKAKAVHGETEQVEDKCDFDEEEGLLSNEEEIEDDDLLVPINVDAA